MMKFSVIIPTRNRPAALADCLHSFTNLNYPAGAWELIVVNDGGDRSFTAVSAQLQATLPLQLVTIKGAGPAAARNAGAGRASGDYLAFTDDDCRVTPDWLQQFAHGFAQTGLAALGGQSLNPQPGQSGMAASQFLIDFLYEYMQDQAGNALLLVSNNVAYRREVFVAAGGFNESFPLAAAEDMELSRRLVQQGCRQAYYPAAKVWHYHQLTAWGHVRQQFRYGRGAYFFHQACRRGGLREIQPANERTFYPALAAAVRRARLPFLTGLLLLAGQVAYQAGSVYQTFSSGRPRQRPVSR
jgi:glycosyltransferase involved in cell wall biosynthesis